MLGLLRTRKNSKLLRNTHNLDETEVGLVRTWKESKPTRHTHFLKEAGAMIGLDTKQNQSSEQHSPSEEVMI